jgi:general secretion pathway protein G
MKTSAYPRSNYRRAAGPDGFTLVEILIVVIILGILAGVVIPQFSNASQDSRSDALKSQLHAVRTAISAYYMEHMDTYPDLSTGWGPLMNQTNAQGVTNGSGTSFGPYLSQVPTNPLSGGSNVATVADVGVDYVWTASTGTITALDGQGNLFNENQ